MLTLGYRNSDDFIAFTGEHGGDGSITVTDNGTVKIADGQTMSDGTNSYTGILTSAQITALTGKTLRPVINNQ